MACLVLPLFSQQSTHLVSACIQLYILPVLRAAMLFFDIAFIYVPLKNQNIIRLWESFNFR